MTDDATIASRDSNRLATVLYWPEVVLVDDDEDWAPQRLDPVEFSKQTAIIVIKRPLMDGTGNVIVTRGGLIAWDIEGMPFGAGPRDVTTHDGASDQMSERLAATENIVHLYTALRLFIRRGTSGASLAAQWIPISANDFVQATRDRPVAGVTGTVSPLAGHTFAHYSGITPLPLIGVAMRHPLPTQIVADALNALDEILHHPDARARLQLLRLHHDACVLYTERSFADSLISGFPAVEALATQWWEEIAPTDDELDLIVGAKLGHRYRSLPPWREPGVQLISELLQAAGAINDQQFKWIDDAREARNNWIHKLDDVSYMAAEAGMDALGFLIAERLAIEVPTPGGFNL